MIEEVILTQDNLEALARRTRRSVPALQKCLNDFAAAGVPYIISLVKDDK